jgi:hypothetical protein
MGLKFSDLQLEFPAKDLPETISVDKHQVVFYRGAKIEDLVLFTRRCLENLNQLVPCRENSLAITKLQEAELWLLARKLDRQRRNVTGTKEP